MTKDEALKLALEALQWNWGGEPLPTLELQAINAIKEALAQPEQEPVAWPRTMERGALIQWLHFEMVQHTLDEGTIDKLIEDAQAIPATLPQRTWVGLTDEEISKISQRLGIDHDDSWTDLKQAIEAKLKERNT